MKIELNGLELDCEAEGGEGRSVTSLSTVESRNVASYDAPGGQSSTFGDLGRGAIKIALEGLVSGKDGSALLEGIWACFKAGDPVEFYSDITGAADITKVLIESMVVKSSAGNRNRYDYTLELLEYREPPEEPEGPATGEAGAGEEEEGVEGGEGQAGGSQADAEALEWAEEVAEDSAAGGNELTGTVLDEAGKPAKNVKVIISGQGQEIEVQTDDSGGYTVPDLATGYYKVSAAGAAADSQTQYISVGSQSKPEEENEEDLRAIESELDEIESLVRSLEIEVENYKALKDFKNAKGQALTLKDRIGILAAKALTLRSAAEKVSRIKSRIQSIKEHLENIVIRAIEKQIEQLGLWEPETDTGSVSEPQPEAPNTAETETTSVEEQVENAPEEIEEAVTETVNEVVDAVEDTVDDVVDTVGGTADAAENAIEDLFGWGDEEEEE